MRRPSVIFVNRVYPPVRGATGRVLRDLSRAFIRDGWDVTILTTAPEAREDYDGGIRIVRFKSDIYKKNAGVYAWLWLRMLVRMISLPRHDLIVTMTDPPMLVVAGRIAARLKKSKHINWCHDLYPDLLPALGVSLPDSLMNFLRSQSRRALKSCDKVIVIGRCMAKHLTHSGMDPRRVSVIPNWPDAELIGAGGRRRGGRRGVTSIIDNAEGARPFEEMFRDSDPRFRILYSGNLGRAHPVDTVLDAAALLAHQDRDIEIVFVGYGLQHEKLAQERARRGLENIRLLPWQPASRLQELMESGDVHLVTMKTEASGLLVPSKLYSALAAGRPCIFVGPDTTETARIIKDFNAGTVVAEGDAAGLAEAIRAYRYNSKTWFSAHEGAAEAGRIFTPEQSINAWIERARDVAQVRPAPQRPPTRKAAA